MQIYSEENSGLYPTVAAPSNPGTYTVVFPTAGIGPAPAPPGQDQAGSPLACLWLMVSDNRISPKQFICKSDRMVSGPAALVDSAFNYYDNFQNGSQISYSIAYPWVANGIGGWWHATLDASVAVASDMAPVNGDGGKNTTAPRGTTTKLYNSDNHEGTGQNVAFGDAHVEWSTSPYAGANGMDNIFTLGIITSQTPISASGQLPAPLSNTTPFDVIMVPCRQTTTGQLY